jgi:hypothetical protein
MPTELGSDRWATYLIIDGLVQAAGLTMLILGLTLRTSTTESAANEPSLLIGPMVGDSGGGLTASGRF